MVSHDCLEYTLTITPLKLTARMKPMLHYTTPNKEVSNPSTVVQSIHHSIQEFLKPPLPRRRNIQTPTLPPTSPDRAVTLKPTH
jgi:hypothetical protein